MASRVAPARRISAAVAARGRRRADRSGRDVVPVLGLTHSSGYTPGMAARYALWAALLPAWRAGRAAGAVFGRPEAGRAAVSPTG